ncbi:hypothetical protein [Blastococcus mobilis]|uniref:Polyketide cyclase / dehydrase and lipid transport n=1 Tax=Blastococcus mobilis TaxID=1938746 RepID=A0A238XPH3_9ACTN|nr:hypothetical protein [Blastococcus mobilis]SNR60847.1 hypothetical protein SAMN06272737_11520 [Blastococcus mobilis]
MDLDDVVPAADHVTRQSRVIDAPRPVVWEELHRLKLRSLPVSLVLSAVRVMPVMLTGSWRGGLDRTFLDVVPIPVLASEPPTAVVFGGVLQAWRLTGGEQPPVLDADGVRDFAEPGWVKIGMEFRLTPAVGGTHLSCETRIAATDPSTRRRFDRYWFVVGPGSSAIRWELLAAVAIRAEARAGS